VCVCVMGLGRGLPAPAPEHLHILVVFEHHFVVLIQVQHRYGCQLSGYATRFGYGCRVHGVYQRLNDSMVGGVEVFGNRERTVAVTVVRVVAGRRDDPIVPTDVGEIHVERMPLADVSAATVLPPFATAPALLLLTAPRRAFPPRWADGTTVLAVIRVHEKRRPIGGPQLKRVGYRGPDVSAIGERFYEKPVIASRPPTAVLRPSFQRRRHV